MQSAVPELTDLRGESAATKRLYGLDSSDKLKAQYARQLLLARRMVERGVRCVEVGYVRGIRNVAPWDQHDSLKKNHGTKAPDTALLDEEMQTAIQAAIDELPEVQRMAIVLRRYDDISYEEIGEILDLSVPAVKSVIFRARTELRQKLRRYLEG